MELCFCKQKSTIALQAANFDMASHKAHIVLRQCIPINKCSNEPSPAPQAKVRISLRFVSADET